MTRRAVGARRPGASAARPGKDSWRSAERRRALLDGSPAGMFLLSWDGRILDCNHACARLLHAPSRKALLGAAGAQFFADRSERAALMAELERHGAFEAREVRLRCIDGAQAWGLSSARLIVSASGERQIEGALLDITDRQETLGVLRDSEARFRTLVETAGAAILCMDARFLITEFNAAAERIFGCARGEVLGRQYSDLFPVPMRAKIHSDFRRVLQGEAIRHFENVVRSPDGRRTVLLWDIRCLSDAAGRPAGIVAVGQDITGRQQTEASLAERNRDLHLLMSLHSTLLTLDEPQLIARAAVRHLVQLPGCVGAAVYEFASESQAPRLLASEGTPARGRDDLVVPGAEGDDGLVIPLLGGRTRIGLVWIAVAPSAHGETAFSEELVQQIASRVAVALHGARLEAARRTAFRRMETLSHRLVGAQEEERRRVARELHDDIGQSLTGLKLALEMSARDGASSEALQHASALASDLIERVRHLSLDLRPAILDDLGLVPTLMWLTERYSAQAGVQIEFRAEGASRRCSSAIETAIYRIAQESLTNVVRHADATRADVRLRQESDRVSIEIRDEGRGFEPGRHTDPSCSGLSNMRERAALLGGVLTVVSAPGEGTLVTAAFPLVRGDFRDERFGASVAG